MNDGSICNVNKKLNILEAIFIVFCLMPFILPNPILTTDVQPYAMIFGLLIILVNIFSPKDFSESKGSSFFFVALATLFVALVVLLFSGISMLSLRALYNYVSVAIIPYATYIVIKKLGRFPEKFIKILILVWFLVGTVQLFISRSFMSSFVSGSRFSEDYRGVIGLASEPSFFGIACFYFLHMAMKFRKHHLIFVLLIGVMGTVYAQSAMGIIFMVGFVAIYMLDALKGKYGKYIWTAVILALIIFLILLNTVFVETRIYELYEKFINGGFDSVTQDESAEVRLNAILRALQKAFDNNLMPLGFQERIGSGYGGFLCELGLFSLPILFCISLAFARTFKKKICRFLYFIVITVLLTNNTQIGNPLLLFVVGMNIAMYGRETELTAKDPLDEEGTLDEADVSVEINASQEPSLSDASDAGGAG